MSSKQSCNKNQQTRFLSRLMLCAWWGTTITSVNTQIAATMVLLTMQLVSLNAFVLTWVQHNHASAACSITPHKCIFQPANNSNITQTCILVTPELCTSSQVQADLLLSSKAQLSIPAFIPATALHTPPASSTPLGTPERHLHTG